MQYISIQIVNYNTKKYLKSLLIDILDDLKDSKIKYEINVLDNNSKDDLSDLQILYKDNKNINFFFSEKNLGFGAGHNFLSEKSKGDKLLILNPDIKFIEKDFIKKLSESFSDEKVAVVGPRLLTDKKIVQRYDHGELKGVFAKIALNSGNSYWKNRDEISEVAWVSGAVFLIKKDVFDSIGGFDENFFLYKEEEDLCLRLRKEGYKIVYNPKIKVLHYGSVVAKKSDHMQKSVDYFLEKHFKGKLGFWFFKFLNKIIH